MRIKIWTELIKILSYRKDLIDTIKPFLENLNNDNINDEKFIPYLKSNSKYYLKLLRNNGIINKEKYRVIFPKKQLNNNYRLFFDALKKEHPHQQRVREIIEDDKMEELQRLIRENNINCINTIQKPFLEVISMKIPIIQYCILHKAIKCFKYLLINGIVEPTQTMTEPFSELYFDYISQKNIQIQRYEWDCMATAIFYGEDEIIKILEELGIEKGNSPSHIEAAILSYRNSFVKEIINQKKEKNEELINDLSNGLSICAKNNNIKGGEILINNGANINISYILFFIIMI